MQASVTPDIACESTVNAWSHWGVSCKIPARPGGNPPLRPEDGSCQGPCLWRAISAVSSEATRPLDCLVRLFLFLASFRAQLAFRCQVLPQSSLSMTRPVSHASRADFAAACFAKETNPKHLLCPLPSHMMVAEQTTPKSPNTSFTCSADAYRGIYAISKVFEASLPDWLLWKCSDVSLALHGCADEASFIKWPAGTCISSPVLQSLVRSGTSMCTYIGSSNFSSSC